MKERVDKRAKHVVDSFTIVKKTTQWISKKHVGDNFNATWTIIEIWKIRDRFHQNFETSLRAHPLLYQGMNLGARSNI
jgi:hypothetical protein